VLIVAFSLIPRERYGSIYDIDPNELKRRGITLLLLDLDNTIAAYHITAPDAQLIEWVSELREKGIEPFILSNSRKPTRVDDFARLLGVPFMRRAGKPRSAGFHKAMELMGRRVEETAMVGDQIFTDILGANRAGISSLLVKPILLKNPFHRLRYGFETPFRLGAKKLEKPR
jgi:HAD superfamily phosphatase (TIGR01668 family)